MRARGRRWREPVHLGERNARLAESFARADDDAARLGIEAQYVERPGEIPGSDVEALALADREMRDPGMTTENPAVLDNVAGLAGFGRSRVTMSA